MKEPKPMNYILGLDLGANSIGWAILEAKREDGRLKPFRIERAGVRIFEEGVENINTSKEAPRAQHRREMRLMRRQADRKARRHSHLFFILQNAGLLPPSEIPLPERQKKEKAAEKRERREKKSEERDQILRELDKKLIPYWRAKLKSEGASQEELSLLHMRFPYVLRARALKEKLEPYELGRALYHLGQRRGFKSNRKSQPKKNEKPGDVEKGIDELKQMMKEKNAETLGQLFSMLNPEKEEEKIRRRWTHRDMYKEEFEKIWAAQQPHYPEILTEDLKEKFRSEDKEKRGAIFYQRPLKDQSNLIGFCELEEGERRAPRGLLIYQSFRLIKTVNNIRVIGVDKQERELSQGQRDKLIQALEKGEGVENLKGKKSGNGDLSISQVKDIIDISNRETFNFGEDEEEAFIGNRTAARIRKALGEEWNSYSKDTGKQDAMVDLLLSSKSDEEIAKEAQEKWGLSQEKAEAFSRVSLEDGYSRLSRKAIEKMMPYLKEGLSEAEAKKQAYPDKVMDRVEEFLPSVQKEMPELTNPVVRRNLNELRKVLNAMIKEYGKPTLIRVEMARDLKKTSIQRREILETNRLRNRDHKKAADEFFKETGNKNPSRRDLDRYLLALECGWKCPYTGKDIPRHNFFKNSPFQVEHIIPLSLCLDDSFANKTLCHESANRDKHNKTPFQAYANGEKEPAKWPEEYKNIIQRVERFEAQARSKFNKRAQRCFEYKDRNMAEEKLGRFKMNDDELQEFRNGFTERQLNDTRYFTTSARKLLSLLYGKEAPTKIQFTSGQITWIIRSHCLLNGILRDGAEKPRDDHRNHAVDAIAIALTSSAMVKRLNDVAKFATIGKNPFGKPEEPWEGFYSKAEKEIHSINVSHRASKKVNGPLHGENAPSPPIKVKGEDGEKEYVKQRMDVKKLSAEDVEKICGDKKFKEIVRDWMDAKGNKSEFPMLKTKGGGREIPIKKVHLLESEAVFPVVEKEGPRHRYGLKVKGTNHHVEIFAVKDSQGKVQRWDGRVITRYEAMQRNRKQKPIIQRDYQDGKEFIFSLSLREGVLMKNKKDEQQLYIVEGVSEYGTGTINIDFSPHKDALRTRKGNSRTPDSLRKSDASKIIVTPLGDIRRSND